MSEELVGLKLNNLPLCIDADTISTFFSQLSIIETSVKINFEKSPVEAVVLFKSVEDC